MTWFETGTRFAPCGRMPTRLQWFLCALPLLPACDSGGGEDAGTTSGGSTSSPPITTSGTTTGDPATTHEETSSTAASSTGTSGDTSSGDSTSDTGSSSGGSSSSGESSTGGDAPAGCFEGGASAAGVTGAGSCADPYLLDLSAEAHGTIVTYTITAGADAMDMGGGGNCLAEPIGTARDVVLHVMMPADVTALLLSVDPSGSSDGRLAVAEDPSCFQPMNACADEGAAGQCEALEAPRGGDGFFGTSTYVVVSELVDSGEDLTLRLQTTNE